MELPPNWNEFRHQSIKNIETLSDQRIWGIDVDKIKCWLNNFSANEIDRYFALALISSLVYRSETMAKSSYKRFVNSSLPDILSSNSDFEIASLKLWRKELMDGRNPIGNLRLHFVGATGSSDVGNGSSDGVITRLLTTEIIHQRFVKIPSKISEDNSDVIVFIDDFIGSGSQFINFAKEVELEKILQEKLVIYAPLMAYQDGIKQIQDKFPKLILSPLELVNSSHSFFSESNVIIKGDHTNSLEDYIDHYADMKKRYCPNMPGWSGRNGEGLPIVFEWGCPNQTLALLWANTSPKVNDWSSAFGRRI